MVNRQVEVQVGAQVTVRDADGETAFWLVPPEESNPTHGRVSTDSPLGRAVLGACPGDEVRFRAPGGVKIATVVAVER